MYAKLPRRRLRIHALALALAPCAGLAPAQPAPVVAPANPATAATIADLAARARAAREAATVPAVPVVPAIVPGSSWPTGLPGPAIPPVRREAGEPRLLSIAGRPGQERVELSFDGTIYSVSLRHPQLGSTGWRLTRVDVADAAVRIDNTIVQPQRPAGRRGAAPDTPTGYTIAFHRRDPEFGPATPSPPGSPAGLR